jgi:phosphohistidine phosphatase
MRHGLQHDPKAMRRLLLLRHATYAAAPGLADPALSETGREEAAAVGRHLAAQEDLPDLVLCSAARRARQTRDILLAAAGIAPAGEVDDAVTRGDEGVLLSRLREIPDDRRTVLVIGHNPTIHNLARALASRGPDEARTRLARGYAPATLTVLDFATETWNEVGRGDGVLRALYHPSAEMLRRETAD